MAGPDLISSTVAARLLGVTTATLRRHESGPFDRRVTHIYGGVLRVYWTSYPNGERRYSRRDIEALLARKSG